MTKSNKIILPKSFEVQLLDEHSNELKSNNILCQLNIFKNDNSEKQFLCVRIIPRRISKSLN